MPVFYCEMSSRWGAGRRFPQHVQAFKAGSNAISSCSVFKHLLQCSGIFKSSASPVLTQIISKLPITVFLHSPNSVTPHKVTTISHQVPIWSSLLSVSICAEVALILGMLGPSPPEISKPFSEFYLPPLLSTGGARARRGDVLDHHLLRGIRGAALQMRGEAAAAHRALTGGDQQEQMQPAQSQPWPICFRAAVKFHLFLVKKRSWSCWRCRISLTC